ncbi:hypothetical protein BV20DRAFT_968135 [Pilatotrama ljubarskyi]|nr:hypothetical protein BV20DRAFT_968135 [Pilatotrama ljubarskyi]
MFTWLQIFRLAALGFTAFCGILVLSLGSHLTSLSIKYFDVYYNFAVLSIAVGAISMLSVPVMLVIDFLRTGAFTSMVLVELVWLSILWVLWIATAALTADQTGTAFATCDFVYPILNQVCNETRAIEAFAFLAWIVLLAYTITLLVIALINANRGAPMWKSSIKQQHPSVLPPSAPSASSAPPIAAQPQMGMMPQFPTAQPGAGPHYPQPMYAGAPPPASGQAYAPVPTASPVSGYATTTTTTTTGAGAAPSTHASYPQV